MMQIVKARFHFIIFILILGAGAVISRLFYIQVINFDKYTAISNRQSQRRVVLKARRGTIYDRLGRPIAVSSDKKVKVQVNTLKANADNTKNVALAELNRIYPFGELAGTVIGYTGRDGYGLGGIESECDKLLSGEDGWTIVRRDAVAYKNNKNRYRTNDLPSKAPLPGSDIYLTIDMDVQKIVQNVLKQTISSLGAKGALGIVMEPNTGKIIAMANEPCFNPNIPGLYPLDQRKNLVVSRNYEPGSTFKVVSAAAALEKGVFSANDSIYGNNGVYEVYDQSIKDHKAFGWLSFTDAMAHSSNVCFAKIADKVGNDDLYRYTRNFGFGSRTDIRLPGEERGIVHPVKMWSGRTRVTMAIGHEITATLLQMAALFGSVANDGVYLQPRIIERVKRPGAIDPDTTVCRPVRRVISANTAATLKAMLHEVVATGTGVRAGIKGLEIAGKTGTSQIWDMDSGAYSNNRYHASFIGFTPVEKPVLLCGIVVDEPAQGEAGGLAAAPAFRKIIRQIISHPRLEYAEKILHKGLNGDLDSALIPGRVPQVCGMSRFDAQVLLNQKGISYEIIGSRDTIENQFPGIHGLFGAKKKMTLYTGRDTLTQVAVPDCRGRDLREAINVLNMSGLVPYVSGWGMVQEQKPAVGSVMKSAEVCSLYCSFGG